MILDDSRRSEGISEASYREFLERRRTAPQKPVVVRAPMVTRSVVARSKRNQAPSPKHSVPVKKNPTPFATNQISEQTLTLCEFCNAAVKPSRIESHKYRVHGIGKRPPVSERLSTQDIPNNEPAPSQAKRQTFSLCPICHWRLRSEDIRSHVEKVHSAPRPSFVPWRQRSKMLVPCPECSSSVRSNRLQNHLQRIHGSNAAISQGGGSSVINFSQKAPSRRERRPKLTKKVASGGNVRYRALSTGSGHSGPSHDDNDERVASVDNYWEERCLDGSRDYWQIREEGRFGSHPSYDACDDESAP
jgi:hypothetical protein